MSHVTDLLLFRFPNTIIQQGLFDQENPSLYFSSFGKVSDFMSKNVNH